MKKLTSLLLAFFMLLSIAVPTLAATGNADSSPYYTNASGAWASLNIDDDGLATITVRCLGKSNVASISVTYYLQKQYISDWNQVNIGTTSDVWTYSVLSTTLSQNRTFQLKNPGNYRVVAEFTVKASTTEKITVYSDIVLN